MKQIKTIAIALSLAFFTATISAQTKNIDVNKSKIVWVGKKVTGKHEGTVNLIDGALILKGNVVTGGNFTADMTSITDTDMKSGEGKEKLEGHLKSDDFFNSEKYPTSKLVFKSVKAIDKNKYTVTGDLTIKGKTNPITFELLVNGNTASAKLVVDRAKYDIKFKSASFFENLGDKTIYDDFDLDVTLQF